MRVGEPGSSAQAQEETWKSLPEYRLLQSLASVKDVRISVVKSFWREMESVTERPEGADEALWREGRLLGTIKKWTNTKEGLLRIAWYDEDQTNSIQSLADDGLWRFEKYADGRMPPASRGAGARGTEERDAANSNEVHTVDYTMGNFTRVLTWTRIAKEGVKVGARTEPRFPPVIKRASSEFDTPFNTWKNICVPPEEVGNIFKPEARRQDTPHAKEH